MNEPLISVIVPVYKVEMYLKRCIDSILNQSYKNLEIILVDDGSPDMCPKICDHYSSLDERVIVIHKINGGLSDARNKGVQISKGEYITFIDSDDYVSKNYISSLYNGLIENNADICACFMKNTNCNYTEFDYNKSYPAVSVFTGNEAVKKLLSTELYLVLVTAWGKLYKTSIIRKYPFPQGKKHEDEATTAKYYYESKKVAVINSILYAYFNNESSITHTIGSKRNDDIIWALNERAVFFKDKNIYFYKLAYTRYVSYLINDSMVNSNRCNDLIKKVNKKGVKIKMRIHLFFYNHFYNIYRFYFFKRNNT